jgi:hypothetical protein
MKNGKKIENYLLKNMVKIYQLNLILTQIEELKFYYLVYFLEGLQVQNYMFMNLPKV